MGCVCVAACASAFALRAYRANVRQSFGCGREGTLQRAVRRCALRGQISDGCANGLPCRRSLPQSAFLGAARAFADVSLDASVARAADWGNGFHLAKMVFVSSTVNLAATA